MLASIDLIALVDHFREAADRQGDALVFELYDLTAARIALLRR